VKRFLLGGLAGAVLVGLMLVAVLHLADLRISDENVKVPSLLGDRPSVAKAKVQALGLRVRVVRSSPSGGLLSIFAPPLGHVARQVPNNGQLVPSNGTVTLYIGYD
jgi:beta-lactam-binding protein with PASTA domain